MDTIFALASGRGRAGVAVVRVSGPDAGRALGAFGVGRGAARRARLRWLRDPATGLNIDQALVLEFAEGASFTGEEVVEFQLHGSAGVVRAVERVLGGLNGFRRAEPGEFTRRAFLNGCMDLTEVEGLSALIDSDTERQRLDAMRRLAGHGAQRVREWRQLLVSLRGMVAGIVDFADEGDVDGQLGLAFDSVLQQLEDALGSALDGRRAGRVLRDGFRIALVGRPNVGKSTLINALAGSDLAIVSEIPGTTRDVLEARLEIDGWPVVVQDLAGIRANVVDPVEQMGISKAIARAELSDLVLLLRDSSADDGGDYADLMSRFRSDCPVIGVWTKADLGKPVEGFKPDVVVSARTGEGMAHLRAAIASCLAQMGEALESAGGGSEREFELIEMAIGRCREARAAKKLGIEFVDDALVRIDHVLGRIVGHVDVDAVLDDVFCRFCIGK